MGIKSIIFKAGAVLKKYSPEICVAVGAVAGIAAVGTAIWKGYDTAKKHSYEKVEEDLQKCETGKEKAAVVIKEAIPVTAKQFIIPATLTATSTTLVLVGFGLMKKRYTAAVLLANTISAAFAKYRENAKVYLGEEKFKEFDEACMNSTVKQVVDEKTGEVKETLEDGSIYSWDILYDEGHPWFQKSPTAKCYDLVKIKSRIEQLNLMRNAKGFLTVNDIRRTFNDSPNYPYECTAEGEIACYGPKEDPREYLNFGLFFDRPEYADESTRRFLDPDDPERNVWIRIRPTTTIDKVLRRELNKVPAKT